MPAPGPGPPVLVVIDSCGSCGEECYSRSQPGMGIMVVSVPEKDTGGERWVRDPHEIRPKCEKLGENKDHFSTRFTPQCEEYS